jgi:hypothetical protein
MHEDTLIVQHVRQLIMLGGNNMGDDSTNQGGCNHHGYREDNSNVKCGKYKTLRRDRLSDMGLMSSDSTNVSTLPKVDITSEMLAICKKLGYKYATVDKGGTEQFRIFVKRTPFGNNYQLSSIFHKPPHDFTIQYGNYDLTTDKPTKVGEE